MQNFFLIIFLIFFLVFPQGLFAQVETTGTIPVDPNNIATDEQLLDVYSITKDELAVYLSYGYLADYVGKDADGIQRSALEIVWNAAQEFSMNPRFLLVLLQREQSLVEDDHPTQDQLDWAMGYSVCDDCSKSDPRIQKFKGFGNQVYFAAQRIRNSYLTDLFSRGYTETGVGPGRDVLIDQTIVIPQNHATSVLYTYTPHLQGNENFARIWNRWFQNRYLEASLLQDKTTGGIWLIQNGRRRPITSRSAFFSRFNPNSVIAVGPSILETYEIGTPIRFPNYSLLRSPRGTVYLIVDDERRGFTSMEAFRAVGFSTDEIVDVTWDDLNLYTEGKPIETATVYPQGVLLQNTQTGGVYFVQNGLKHPIQSREILSAHFPSATLRPTSPTDLETYQTGDSLLFPDGTLVGITGSPDVFVIEQGVRRPILNEATFFLYKWRWDQIVWTNARSVLIHPLGSPLDVTFEETDVSIANL
jgi:hypothetical protein